MAMAAIVCGGAALGLGAKSEAPPRLDVRITFEGGYAWTFSHDQTRADMGSVLLPMAHPNTEHDHPWLLTICDGTAEPAEPGTTPTPDQNSAYLLTDWHMTIESGATPYLEQDGWGDVLDLSAEHNRPAAPPDQVFGGYMSLSSGTLQVTSPKDRSDVRREGKQYKTRKMAHEVTWTEAYSGDALHLYFEGLRSNNGRWGALRIRPESGRISMVVSPGAIEMGYPNQPLPQFLSFYRVLDGPAIPDNLRLLPYCPEHCDNRPPDCHRAVVHSPGDACPTAQFSQ